MMRNAFNLLDTSVIQQPLCLKGSLNLVLHYKPPNSAKSYFAHHVVMFYYSPAEDHIEPQNHWVCLQKMVETTG